ncbi:MAG TPA: serine hydrolase [Cytophagaceae bacterium]|nr:serine hydrolase [Cytophagaceae bacterium]
MRKKILRSIGFLFLAGFLAFNGWVLLSGKQYFYKALIYNFADIDDYKIFPKRIINKSSHPVSWSVSSNYNKKDISPVLRKYLDSIETVALLIVKNDSIQYEKYWDNYSDSSYSNSFSMAKSYISALVGAALKEGKIKSIDQPVCDYLPEFCEGEKKQITIRHLLMMSSGLNWEEGYSSPFSPTTEAYYGTDLKKLMAGLKPSEEPGKIFRYKSGDTQILSFVLEKATGKFVSDYAQENLWEPLGCERDAIWSLDKDNGYEKAYCCINSNVRDFAKFGKLYLDSGRFEGKTIIPQEYLLNSIQPNLLPDGDLDMKKSNFYGYQWWIIPDYKGHFVFYARGILGQYIIVVPDQKMIIVRLGKKRGERIGKHYKEIFLLLDDAFNR